MSEEVLMPALGESVTEGTVTQWLKQVGDTVEVDEPLLEVSTDKVDTEIPSPVAGTVQEIRVQEDETVEVGTVLAVVGSGDAAPAAQEEPAQEEAPAQAEPAQEAPASEEPAQQEQAPAEEAPAAAPSGGGGGEEVVMPALGESVTEGTVTQWLKQVGDTVEVDEPLLEVSTDKVDTEIPSPVAGTVQEIRVQEDETVEVGTVLAVVGSGDAAPAAQEEPAQEEAPAQAEPAQEAPASEEPAQQEHAPAEEAPAAAPSGGGGGEEVVMPALGESVTEGTVTQWLKQVGDTVEVDEPLLEVSTDKVDTEIPSPVAGTVQEIRVQEDETVEVGTVLAVVGSGDAAPAAQEEPAQEEAPAQAEPAQAAPAPEAAAAEETPAPRDPAPAQESAAPSAAPEAPAAEPVSGGSSGYVTPLVRKLAKENDIDLDSVKGTGVGGRIRKQDVQAAIDEKAAAAKAAAAPAAAPASAPAAKAAPRTPATPSPLRGTTEKMSRRRKIIASRMVESLQVAAQLTSVVEVDLTRVARLRERAKAEFREREGVNLSYLSFLSLAAIEALKAHPKLNASIDGDEVTYYGAEHLGMAVDTEQGLVVPVIRDAGDLNIAGIARKIADVAERTRNNKIGPDELSGGSFTITNTGSRGALFDTPIINQPQVAILGTGAVVKRPVVISDGEGGETIAIRSMIYLALSYDHRLVDGADAARFLVDIKARLEEGDFEADLGL